MIGADHSLLPDGSVAVARPSRDRRSYTSREVKNKQPHNPVFSNAVAAWLSRNSQASPSEPYRRSLPRASLQFGISLTKERIDETVGCRFGSWLSP